MLLVAAWKFFGPALRGQISGQAAQWRSENKYIAQLESARDRAFAERDAIAKERDELFQNFASLNARFTVLEEKFDASQKQVALLTEKFSQSESMVAQLTLEIQKLSRGINEANN